MELNSIIFPAPQSTYASSTYKSEQIYIPRTSQKPNRCQTVIKKKFKTCTVSISIESDESKETIFRKPGAMQKTSNDSKEQLLDKIPCIFIQFPLGSNKFIVYFHGNAEDIGASYEFATQLSYTLKVNVIVVEYPGYGVYLGTASSQQILKDSEIVFDYLTNCQGINPQDIIVFGRSIGSGPATHIAAYRQPNSLIIMSGFTSLKAVISSMIGKLPSVLIQERFKNIEKMAKIRCPICFLHGAADQLIPMQHAEDLMRAAVNAPTYINIGSEMTHNEFYFGNDVATPLLEFFEKQKIQIVNKLYDNIRLTKEIYEPPRNLDSNFKQDKSLLKKIYQIVS